MKKIFTSTLALAMVSTAVANEANTKKIGVTNFSQCLSDSKYGKKEQESLENLRNHMQSLVQDTEKSLKEKVALLQDPDHLDGLSPDAEKELRMQVQMLSEEMGKYQNQFYQVLNQAQMKMVQNMSEQIKSAAETVAKSHGFSFVVNKDACFYYDEDVTNLVLEQLDVNFDIENKPEHQE